MYARIVGIALALLGVAGLLDILDVKLGDDVLCLVTGAVFLYASFRRWEAQDTRFLVGGMGVLYLLSGGFVVSLSIMAELSLDLYDVVSSIMRTAFGALSIFSARFLRCEDNPPPAS